MNLNIVEDFGPCWVPGVGMKIRPHVNCEYQMVSKSALLFCLFNVSENFNSTHKFGGMDRLPKFGGMMHCVVTQCIIPLTCYSYCFFLARLQSKQILEQSYVLFLH